MALVTYSRLVCELLLSLGLGLILQPSWVRRWRRGHFLRIKSGPCSNAILRNVLRTPYSTLDCIHDLNDEAQDSQFLSGTKTLMDRNTLHFRDIYVVLRTLRRICRCSCALDQLVFLGMFSGQLLHHITE